MIKLKDEIIQNYILIEGVILDASTFVFCAELLENKKKGISIAYIFYFINGNWELRYQLEMQPISITHSPYQNDEVFILGREGECIRINNKNINISNNQNNIGPFRKIRNINGVINVLGEDCSLWKFSNENWTKIKDGLDEEHIHDYITKDDVNEDDFFNQLIDTTEVAFSIAGNSDGKIILVGTGGRIWLYDGKKWIEDDVPTNLTLFDVSGSERGDYLICGIKGTVIVGRSQQWHVMNFENVDSDFYSITEFLGKIFVADGHSLFKIEKNIISKIDFGISDHIPSHFVTARLGTIMSLAAKEVFISNDGVKWDSLLF